MKKFVHDDVLMKIVGNHPWTGHLCHPMGDSAETITEYDFDGRKTYLVQLAEPPFDTEQVYAAKSNLQLLSRGNK